MGNVWQDVRYGLRALRKSPGFTLVALLALGLGIGANTAIFSVINAVLLRPLPYQNPDRIVTIEKADPEKGVPGITSVQYLAWREQNKAFEQLGAFSNDNINLTGGGEPERVSCALVSANFFPLFGVRPAQGRAFLPEEDAPGRDREVVISHSFWLRRYGGDPSLVGKSVTLNDASYTVVGIMPEGFCYPAGYDIWMPLALNPAEEGARRMTLVEVVARLKPGVSLEGGRAELDVIGARLAAGEMAEPTELRVTPLQQQLVGSLRPVLLVVFGAVGLVLLIACANVANLQLARTAARERELAIRAALGASRRRLARQLVTESAVLGLLGGALGLLLSAWFISPLVALIPESIAGSVQGVGQIKPDAGALCFTFAVSCLTVFVFGVAPALQGSKPNLNASLKEAGGGRLALGRGGLRRAFVVLEIALTFVLLVGASLLVRSFDRLTHVDAGFNPGNVLTMRIDLPRSRYALPAQSRNFYQQLLERVAALPGVRSAGVINHRPFDGFSMVARLGIEGAPPASAEVERPIPVGVVSPDYFRALGIPIVGGRGLTGEDTTDSMKVALANQSFARRFGARGDVVGKRVSVGCQQQELCRTIVGVVGDVRQEGLSREPTPELYVPYTQGLIAGMTLVVKTDSDPSGFVNAVRGQVLAIDKEQPVSGVRTLAQYADEATARTRSLMMLLLGLAGLALLLASLGIYGVVSYAVTQRTREIGIRMALGARAGDVLRLVLGQGLKLTLLGLALGLAGAAALTRLMTRLLYGVSASDPAAFLVVTVFLGAVALLACYVPARRATRVDPMIALRHE
ncbi:MAG: ABC transporter permease [Pyrinomonadaceae bacterium]